MIKLVQNYFENILNWLYISLIVKQTQYKYKYIKKINI